MRSKELLGKQQDSLIYIIHMYCQLSFNLRLQIALTRSREAAKKRIKNKE